MNLIMVVTVRRYFVGSIPDEITGFSDGPILSGRIVACVQRHTNFPPGSIMYIDLS
jgi:hypothetical protein